MTNYNERLDEILNSFKLYLTLPGNAIGGSSQDEAKQALTSLIKELVAEAKPGYRKPSYGNGVDESLSLSYSDKEYDLALDEFEQNLLKALEEV